MKRFIAINNNVDSASLSARRAWIETPVNLYFCIMFYVALRKEGVD